MVKLRTTPSQVLDLQADLVARLDDWRFQRYSTAGLMPHEQSDEEGQEFALQLQRQVRAAYAYTVTPEMTAVLTQAQRTLPDDEVVDKSHAPTGAGIVRFDQPVKMQETGGRDFHLHWLTWGPGAEMGTGKPGTYISFWTDNRDPDQIESNLIEKYGPEHYERVRRIAGTWSPCGSSVLLAGEPIGPRFVDPPAETVRSYAERGQVAGPAETGRRLCYALWLLLSQTLTATVEERPDRPTARRAKRMQMPGRVCVVALRRSESVPREPGETMVEWQHRWVVRGHWRNQPCGPGRSETRRIYVNPFVKGPADKPLVVTDKVYAFRR